MMSRAEFDRLSNDQKFATLYGYALAAFQAGEKYSAALVHLEEKLQAKIDAMRPGDGA
jgi:hypothetical protein